MRNLIWAVALLLVLPVSIPSNAAEYWPMHDGAIYHYRDSNGNELTVSYTATVRRITSSGNPNIYWEHYSVDCDGDVMLSGESSISPLAPDPDSHYYNPEIRFLDFPLYVGKEWETLSFDNDIFPFFYRVSVLSEETVTVPMGTYEVFAVSTGYWGTHYLNRDLGPVILDSRYQLVSIENFVGTVDKSWSSVKDLYK